MLLVAIFTIIIIKTIEVIDSEIKLRKVIINDNYIQQSRLGIDFKIDRRRLME